MPVSFPVMAPTPWSPLPGAVGGRRNGAAAREHHQRRSDGAPAAEGRHARHHAARDRSAPPPARRCNTRRNASADRNNAAGVWRRSSPSASVLVASADDRTWRTLPSEISIARARLPARCAHVSRCRRRRGRERTRVELTGRYAVIDLWLLRQQLYGYHPETQKGEAQDETRMDDRRCARRGARRRMRHQEGLRAARVRLRLPDRRGEGEPRWTTWSRRRC